MYNSKWVEASLRLVLSNQGSKTAGVDGVTKKHLKDEKRKEAFIQNIIFEIKNDIYEAQPAKRVYIPKAKGGKRPLGISTLKDRVVQQTLKLIIEPIFESDFLDCSIGFRPNRCCHDALPVFYNQIQPRNKYYWVIEGDIKSCFDKISHKILLRIIKRRIKDKKLLGLTKKLLKAGYIEDGVVNKPGYGIPSIGTPQGAICSPLFANIYLHEFDKWFDSNYGNGLTPYQKLKRRQAGEGNAILIRFADDFVILWNGVRRIKGTSITPPETAVDAETMKEQVRQFLWEELGLELSEEKTLITHVNNGFDFLGFHIQRYRMKSGDVLLTTVPDEKIKEFKQKIQMMTRRRGANYESAAAKVMAMNKIINGWAEYYRYTNWKADSIPARMDYFISRMMFRWAKKKHGKLSWRKILEMYRHRQKGFRTNGGAIDRWNFGVKASATYVTDEEIIWLAQLSDKKSVKYLPKRKPNPFIVYQYEVEAQNDIWDEWEGRSGNPYGALLHRKSRRCPRLRNRV